MNEAKLNSGASQRADFIGGETERFGVVDISMSRIVVLNLPISTSKLTAGLPLLVPS